MKKVLTFTLLAALAALPALAQQNPQGYAMVRYDLDALAITYCSTSDPLSGPGAVTNASSSTTITGADLTQDVFAAVEKGDVIYVTVVSTSTTYTRGVLSKTDADNVVLDEAVDFGGNSYSWTYRDQTCGTASTDGWVSVSGLEDLTIGLFFPQMVGDVGVNGIDVRVEGTVKTPDGSTNPTQLWPTDKTVGGVVTVQNFDTAGVTSNVFINVTAPIDSIRVGMFFNTADDALGDLTTNAEQITAVLFGQQGGN
jgi:hypothetical protein